ncbi:hypothetical protein [Rhodoferax sp.]|nr:hypothetical protein [Rhodoferax sp.]MBE0473244.1 hypothetical protein [Rhodoferax sp.]
MRHISSPIRSAVLASIFDMAFGVCAAFTQSPGAPRNPCAAQKSPCAAKM